MAYYNELGKKVSIDKRKMQYLNCGKCAGVFHDKNTIFKEYFPNTPYRNRLSLDMFKLLKSIHNKHFIELYSILSDMGLSDLLLYKFRRIPFSTTAYTAKYYSDNAENPLYESIDYTLDNFYELEKLFTTFTENKITVNDVKRENSILGKNNIVIVDPDCFSIAHYDSSLLAIDNKIELLMLLRSIYIAGAKGHPNYKKIKKKVNAELVAIAVDENTNITSEIAKKLKYVKRPIDYFLKK